MSISTEGPDGLPPDVSVQGAEEGDSIALRMHHTGPTNYINADIEGFDTKTQTVKYLSAIGVYLQLNDTSLFH
ncbi:hypothetical protein TcasGA2_TC011363 [Tribolium castaneum]|uniref:Uncharacterized protein n=1 Tax=Tribolium castaneum TaxID=7070 RepID=D6X480_TRICA|nr:hypothetical protein TcasGA2_TC011363 [Tribolium castaneum]